MYCLMVILGSLEGSEDKVTTPVDSSPVHNYQLIEYGHFTDYTILTHHTVGM